MVNNLHEKIFGQMTVHCDGDEAFLKLDKERTVNAPQGLETKLSRVDIPLKFSFWMVNGQKSEATILHNFKDGETNFSLLNFGNIRQPTRFEGIQAKFLNTCEKEVEEYLVDFYCPDEINLNECSSRMGWRFQEGIGYEAVCKYPKGMSVAVVSGDGETLCHGSVVGETRHPRDKGLSRAWIKTNSGVHIFVAQPAQIVPVHFSPSL